MMRQQTVQRVGAKILIPYILLYAFYVQFHGDFGPGGGFQAGVILAAGVVLFSLIFGIEQTKKMVPPFLVLRLVALGVLIYGGVGVLTMVSGGNFLEYRKLGHDPIHSEHMGILWIEAGVGITVAAVMLLLFYCFAGRKRA